MSLVSSLDAICRLIPQRPPFILVDELISFQPDGVVAGFRVPEGHILISADGYLTESGVVEHFAQAIALYQGYDYFLRHERPPVGYIGSIKNFEISALPKIGDVLETHIRVLQQLFGVTAVRGEVRLLDQVIAIGEMRTVIAKDLE